MKLICGLGNPGAKYAKTRHNAGFLFLDSLALNLSAHDFIYKKDFDAFLSEVGIGNDKSILLKPATFMNLSGIAVLKAKKFYKIDNNDICIVYDDIDLPIGSIRFRTKGTAGTHNGMKSILTELGTENIARLRLGIENRPDRRIPLDAYVLSPFTEDELILFNQELIDGIEVLKNSLAI